MSPPLESRDGMRVGNFGLDRACPNPASTDSMEIARCLSALVSVTMTIRTSRFNGRLALDRYFYDD
jgi:hypothetical protein